MANTLYYGDNLDILRRYIADESVDLIYLDPPFNSNTDYNVLFAEKDGSDDASQVQAFGDTWRWNNLSEATYAELMARADRVTECLQAFRTFLGPCDMLAYLVMMAPRLVELRRVMKPTASIYLHCDPTASHYLKMLMDAVFGPDDFRCDIRWKRTSAHGNVLSNYAWVSDQLLFYTKGQTWIWHQQYQPYSPGYVGSHYGQEDADGRRFTTRDLTASMQRASSGQLYDWKGIRPVSSRCWSFTRDKMEEFEAKGLLVYGRTGVPRLKLYLDDQAGTPLPDIWDDVPPINSQAAERLGYPTQKPVALLERIIQASSNPGDVVLDPFCGCGTTIEAAQKLRRRWVGIDITHLAINLIKQRLLHALESKGNVVSSDPGAEDAGVLTAADGLNDSDAWFRQPYVVVGEPTSLAGALELAATKPMQFQYWALGLVSARPLEQKHGADRGIDGKIVFRGDAKGKYETIIIQVKAGQNISVQHIRDLRGVIEREQAVMGIFISVREPTRPMLTEAATAGVWDSKSWNRKFPRLQIATIEDLLARKLPELPHLQFSATFRRASVQRAHPVLKQPTLLSEP